MKKLFYFVIGLLLIIPLSVKADMGAPMIRGIVVTPKSPSGAPCYGDTKEGTVGEKVGTINYGENVYYYYERKIDGTSYADVFNLGKCSLINLSDFKLADEKNKNDIFADTDLYKGRTFLDLKVYLGPSSTYEQIGIINKNTEIKLSSELYDGTWVYVVSNGIEGYADIADGAAGYLVNIDAVALIPSMKKYTDYIYILDSWSNSYMVKDGSNYVQVPVSTTYIPNKTGISAKVIHDIELYDDIYRYELDSNGNVVDIDLGEKVLTVPKGSEVTIIGFRISKEPGCLVSYNGRTGWDKSGCSNYDFEYNIPDNFIKYISSEYFYKDGTAKVLDVTDYEQIKNDKDIINLLKDPNKDTDIDNPNIDDPNIDEPDPSDLPAPDIDDDGSKDSMSLRTIILLCSLGGIVVVSTGIVILILINKKKKEKVKNMNIEKESN